MPTTGGTLIVQRMPTEFDRASSNKGKDCECRRKETIGKWGLGCIDEN